METEDETSFSDLPDYEWPHTGDAWKIDGDVLTCHWLPSTEDRNFERPVPVEIRARLSGAGGDSIFAVTLPDGIGGMQAVLPHNLAHFGPRAYRPVVRDYLTYYRLKILT